MGRESFTFEGRRCLKCSADSWKVFGRSAEAAHAGIEVKMNGMLRRSNSGRSFLQQLDLAEFPDIWSQLEPYDLFFFTAPESGHQQDSRCNAFFAQRNGFIERGDPEPGCAFLLESPGTFHRSVAVRISLDHCADGDRRAHVFRKGAVVLAQTRKRYFGPGGAGCCALRDLNGGHFRDYSRAK